MVASIGKGTCSKLGGGAIRNSKGCLYEENQGSRKMKFIGGGHNPVS